MENAVFEGGRSELHDDSLRELDGDDDGDGRGQMKGQLDVVRENERAARKGGKAKRGRG